MYLSVLKYWAYLKTSSESKVFAEQNIYYNFCQPNEVLSLFSKRKVLSREV